MAVIEDILSHQLSVDAFHDQDAKVSGIARRAVDLGFDQLSPAQQRVLNPFLSQQCSGYTDPAEHNDCEVVLEGELLLEAYEESQSDYVQCEHCRAESADIAHRREVFFRD
ncbi:hypothetical protein [Aeromonas veronii]|uniref:hypothetical protein n=1 Tax=Aeromonas veronii TaxID=654 RepID=UPI004055912F